MLKNIRKLQLQCMAVVVVLMTIVPFLTGFDIVRHVTVAADGKEIKIQTNTEDPAQIIREAGVTLNPGDTWKLRGSNWMVQDRSVIEVVRAKKIIVVRNGEEKEYKSTKENVGKALKDLGIAYKRSKVYPETKTELTENMKIYVLDKDEELHIAEAEIEAPVEYVDDFNIEYGKEALESEGRPGQAKVISRKVKKDDGTVEIVEIGRDVHVKPESKIVRRGMASSVWTPEGYKRYTKKFTAEASAYVATGNRTSIGLVPYVGIVAVDPRVIPYYTKMYIPGYGIAMAGDSGGSIKGYRLDLFFDDYHEAIQWGRRDVEVYILEG